MSKKKKSKSKTKDKDKNKKKKKQPVGLDMWTFIIVPPKGYFVLVSNGPYQDFPAAVETLPNKEALIVKGKTMRSKLYSSLVIYDHKKKEVWNANLPSTM